MSKDFFDSHYVKVIKKMPNGEKYVLIYLQLMCESTSHEGRLRFSDTIPYNEDMLSSVLDCDVDTLRSAMKIFRELKLIELLDDGTYYMNEVQKILGSETGQTIRKRLYEYEKNSLIGKSEVKNTLYIRDKSIEKEKENIKEKISYEEIITYLNEKVGTHYKVSSEKTRDLIKARWNQGFRLDDFKKVIDNKVADWKNDNEMSKYLRPDTLFSNKFESYLNQVGGSGSDNPEWLNDYKENINDGVEDL